MPTVKVGELDIAYEEHGEGPALLFIMGFTGTRHHWLGFHRRLADRFRVIAFDNRGAGETTVTRAPYAIAQMAGDALGLLDALGVARAHVLGVSMGGMIAQELALAAPSRVDRLVLGCTHFGGATQVSPAADVLDTFSRVGKQSAEKTVRDMLDLNFTPEYAAANAPVYEGLVQHGLGSRMSPFGFFGQMAAIGGHDTAGRVSTIDRPTLVLAGDRDRLIPVENSSLLAARVPAARLHVLPGIAHMFWVEAPDAAEAAVREFLSLPSGARGSAMHGHATISLWQREEDGSYQAEKDGWKLHVTWTPEPAKGGDHGFRWVAEGPDGKRVEAPELLEEIEIAMMTAEHVAAHDGKLPDAPLGARGSTAHDECPRGS